MNQKQWLTFFEICADVLGEGDRVDALSPSWCSWTTFDRLANDAGYWTSGLPRRIDIRESHIADGGTWGLTFPYSSLAHVIIPATFYWERYAPGAFENGKKPQAIKDLSVALTRASIPHRLSELALEIKLY